MKQYDCIVIGTGGVGSAALYHHSQRGIRALERPIGDSPLPLE